MPDDLFKKLDQVLTQDKEKAKAATPDAAAGQDEAPLDSPRVRIQRAREQVLTLTRLLSSYVETEIAPRYPDLFKARILTHHETLDAPAFGRPKSSAEHGVVQVLFKETHVLAVRFSAVILSREIEVETSFHFRKEPHKATHRVWDLTSHLHNGRVQWPKAFEAIFVAFVEWYGAHA